MNINYGGAFNPPTIAHLNIMKKLYDTFEVSNLIVLPVGNDYQKPYLIDFKYRFDMLQLLEEKLKHPIVISDIENQKAFDGTIESLKTLSLTYNNIHYVIGSDNLESLKKWIKYKELLRSYPFIIMNRNHYLTKEKAEEMFKDVEHQFIFVDFDMDISSTDIRKNIKDNKHMLTKEVYQYILKNRLYGDGLCTNMDS